MNPAVARPTLGILGSGQLGRMTALAARSLGVGVRVLSPDRPAEGGRTPAGALADREWTCPYDDETALTEFAAGVDAVTIEFENIPAHALETLERLVPVRPGARALHVAQNRLREKTFLEHLGVPTTAFRAVRSPGEARAAFESLGSRAILKTAGFGYDGKGQARVRTADHAERAFTDLGASEAILEAHVDFERELSVLAARGTDGTLVTYDLLENRHADGILDLTVTPDRLEPTLQREAHELARAVLEALAYVGVACIELFDTGRGLLVNEIAPRPHNSGHLTTEAHDTSQFAQGVRAALGLPLGSTRRHASAAMANLLGDLWAHGEPDWHAALADPRVTLHLYGKAEARPGRKMGHLVAVGDDAADATDRATRARERAARTRRD